MADAAGRWDGTTFSTVSSIAKLEKEITELASEGSKTYSVTGGDVSAEFMPDSIDVSDGKGTLELIGIASTECVFDAFSISLQESDDDETFADYGTGLTVYSKTGTVAADTVLFRYVIPSDFEDYLKPKITVGTSTGTISIYVNTIWQNKIDTAKEMLGTDVSLLLMNNVLLDYLEEDDDILDSVYNPSIFGLVSDFKVLELIYSDLASGADNESLFWQKSINYNHKYEEYLKKQAKLATIDLTQDGNNLIYYTRLDFIPEIKR